MAKDSAEKTIPSPLAPMEAASCDDSGRYSEQRVHRVVISTKIAAPDLVQEQFSYIYQYKDHLGNSRVSYTEGSNGNSQVVEENSYYAFGLQHKGYGPASTGVGNAHAEKYRYLGQERQEELGLGWDSFRHRNYDYAIGRFFGVDPIAEEYMTISPYQFAHNSPIWKIELEGLEGQPTSGQDVINDEEQMSAMAEKSVQQKLQQNATSLPVTLTQNADGTLASYITANHTVTVTYDLEGREPIGFTDFVGDVNNVIDNVSGAIEDNAGNTRIGSNDRLYFDTNGNGSVFHGNQHVSTSALSEMGSSISKYTGPIGDLIDVANIGTAMYKEGGIGPETAKAAAGTAGGAIGGEMGAWAGAEAGLYLGTLVGGPVGGVIGGIVGGIAGGIAGGYFGGEAGESLIKN